MRQTSFYLLIISSLLIFLFSCSSTPKRSRKPVSSIQIMPKKNYYQFGEKVQVQVKTRVKNGELAHVKVYYNNELIHQGKDLEISIDHIELNSIGNESIRVEAEKTDGLRNTANRKITVLSDIVPKQLSPQIKNQYPHSREFYTQGLEYHQGFLFEGTGENGKSGLYKVNITSGKVLQSFKMADKYFGEGITILNNKIYQLTYKAQKGFVYSLEDFAVIDSFQYKSKQGWGLTNDGAHLIMSDGSHIITWLDPSDYSEVKNIEVATHRGLLNNINELEYVDGIIYANIYTTNLIVAIDAETGKIVSEINLTGLIDLYKNNKDRIDVLNGIAYNKQNQHFYVTGKLWPKLFEMEFTPKNQ